MKKLLFAVLLLSVISAGNAFSEQVYVSSASGLNSAINNAVNGDTITITQNFTANVNISTINNRNITINNNNATTDYILSGNNAYKGFHITNSTVSINNINLSGFRNDVLYISPNYFGYGSALYANSSMIKYTGTNILFRNNISSVSVGVIGVNGDGGSMGGAIYSNNTAFIFESFGNITFSSNTAYGWSGSASYSVVSLGGAICSFYDSVFTFESSGDITFSYNMARGYSRLISGSPDGPGHGGAIYSRYSTNSFASFGNITFLANTVYGYGFQEATAGGAIYSIYSTNSFTSFSNIAFSSNIAYGYSADWGPGSVSYGGAIFSRDSTNSFVSSGDIVFSWNIAHVHNYVDISAAVSGGAIYSDNSTNSFDSSGNISFTNNSVSASALVFGYGGAIYSASSIFTFKSSEDINFTNNSSNSNLSLIYSIDSAFGGAIYSAYDSVFTFDSSVDINFTSNSASGGYYGYGGAIYSFNGNLLTFASLGNITFSNNMAGGTTSGIGGAVYAQDSMMAFSADALKFENNTASSLGGAFYIAGASSVSFNALNSDMNIVFKDNYANGQLNDIYLDIYNSSSAVLNFNAVGGDIILANGIRVDGDGSGTVNKTGNGNLILSGETIIENAAFNITGGDIIMLADAAYKGDMLKLENTSRLDMHNGTLNTVDVTGNFESKKGLIMDIFYNKSNDKITATTADIGGDICIFAEVGTYDNEEFNLIITNGEWNLTGEFANSWINDDALSYELKYVNGTVKLIVYGMSVTHFGLLKSLTYNQKETARVFDKISETPGAYRAILSQMRDKQNAGEIAEVKDFLSQTSGYFLANVIRNMAADSPNNEVYDKIRNHVEEKETNNGLWVQMKGGIERFKSDENSLEDYRDLSMGVMFGFDRFLSEKLADGDIMWGVYGRINKDYIEQGKHKADGNKNGLGVYGGYIREEWELKAMLLGSYDKFSTERAVMGETAKADINAITVSADAEAALRIKLTEDVKLKPYFGMELENTMYGGFKERGADIYNLDVKDGSYLRSAARIGAGVDYEKDIWVWYANVEGKYKMEGVNSEIETKFENTGFNFNSRGTEEGKIEIGIGAGAEVEVALNWKVFANAKYYAGERYENLYGNAGVRYMFGNKKRLPNEDAEKQYNKAQKLYNKGEYLRATDMLSEIIASQPDFEPSKRLHTKIQDEMNKTAASREEADFSKVTYAKGYCAYYKAEYNAAIKEWAKHIEFAGINNEISEYMKKVNNMLKFRDFINREAELDAKAEEMLDAGIEKYNASKWMLCIKDMEALQKFVTENKFAGTEEYYNKAKEYITLSANELAKAMKTEKKATSKPKEPEPQAVEEKQPEIDEAEADKKYNEGLVLYAQGKYLEAERTWELTLRLNPNHQKAKIALSKIRSSGQFE